MDSKNKLVDEQQSADFYVAQFKTTELAIFSYYVQSGSEAVLIDPLFDGRVYLDLISKRQSVLKYVLLTHYHSDFLAGHGLYKVPVIMGKNSKREDTKFELQEIEDGGSFKLGSSSIQVIHTPGHTIQSSCFLLHGTQNTPVCLFTGDTAYFSEIGRPDLASISKSKDLTVDILGNHLFDSIQKLKLLNDDIRMYAAHGAGNVCGKANGGGVCCILGSQKSSNLGFIENDRNQFVKWITSGLAQPPKYYQLAIQANQAGSFNSSEILLKANKPLSVQEFEVLSQKLPIIDTRLEVGAGLIKGVYWLPAKGAIAYWASFLLSPDSEYLLFTDPGKWEEAAERLLRVGYFNIKGYNNFSISEWKRDLNKPDIVNFETYKNLKEPQHLDVRNKPEYVSGGVAEPSYLIPLPQLESRLGELKDANNLVVNCRTGLRARVAHSILAKHGIYSTVFAEHFDHFGEHGFTVIPYKSD